jgi:hypothetical protein
VNAILSALSHLIWVVPIVCVIFAWLIFSAIRRKERVSALFMHGKTVFMIDARGTIENPEATKSLN